MDFLVGVQSLSRVRLLVTPWAAACQAFLSFTISQSLLKLMGIESMTPSNHLIPVAPLWKVFLAYLPYLTEPIDKYTIFMVIHEFVDVQGLIFTVKLVFLFA